MHEADKNFRAASDECRRLAARTTDPLERQELQRIADQWMMLAQLVGSELRRNPA